MASLATATAAVASLTTEVTASEAAETAPPAAVLRKQRRSELAVGEQVQVLLVVVVV